jgi:hypothetical protein
MKKKPNFNTMRSLILISNLIFLLFSVLSCSKEIQIEIPGYQEQLVVDGRIDAGGFPIVILTKSKNIYAASNFSEYLASMIFDASISVNNGTEEVILELISVSQLPLESQYRVAEMLKIEFELLPLIPFQVYSSTNPQIKGEVGKTYTIKINHNNKLYEGTTQLLEPVALDYSNWKPDVNNSEFGTLFSRLTDPINVRNAYKWEVKLITSNVNGLPRDVIFRSSDSPYFADNYFDGLSFEFETRYHAKDTSYPEGYRRHYKYGDSLVIKMSRVDNAVYEFFEKKEAQAESAGNPFSTPVNIPSNLNNGALGIWAGFAPWYDTVYCIP